MNYDLYKDQEEEEDTLRSRDEKEEYLLAAGKE